jgi:membrane-bound lytic murein transglycosylase MltF
VVITGPASPTISRLDDLAGKEVFVRKSSSYRESLLALNQRFAAEKKTPMILKEAPEELEDEDLIEMLNAGLVPLLIVDKHKADFWRQVFPKITVHDDLAIRTGGEIAWAVRKGKPQLKAMLDEFAVAATSGKYVKQRERIYANYLKNTQFVKDAASEKERRKFLSLIDFFQKYGDKYDVDWLLMAAQGYQESGLDQKARSHVGAIGVMQIMPATGKELKVGDIPKVEANIHGGIKYMRWMIDQYYGKEPMTRLDKALFAFASYNAGAGRVSQLRREAAQTWPGPQCLVPQRGICRRREDRPRDRHLRQQHLQVLHRLPADPGSPRGKSAGYEKVQGQVGAVPQGLTFTPASSRSPACPWPSLQRAWLPRRPARPRAPCGWRA